MDRKGMNNPNPFIFKAALLLLHSSFFLNLSLMASADNSGEANAPAPFPPLLLLSPLRPPVLHHPANLASKFLRTVHDLVFQNPFIRDLVSLKMEFHNICRQIHCRKLGSLSLPSNHSFAAVLPGDSVAGLLVANGLANFLNLYNTLLVVRLVLTWFPNAPPAIVSPLSTICDPYLNIFRGIIPPLGGTLDFSPILAFILLNAFTSTAAALPMELPPVALIKGHGASSLGFENPTASKKKWMRRLQGSQSKRSENVA